MVIVLALDSPRCLSSAFCYGYLFMKRSNPVLLISQIYIQLFTILYYVVLFCIDQPLIHYSEIKCTCGYVLGLDSSRGCGYLLMKHSSPALIRTEPRSHAEKKKSNKTCCNQNLLALPLSVFDYPSCCISVCCYGHIFTKHCSPVLLISQPWIQYLTIVYYVVLF